MSENTKLNDLLEQGETIQWSGVPQPYSLFDESRKSSTIFTIVLALAIGALLVGGYYGLSTSQGVEIKTGVVVFLVLIPVFIVWVPISDRNKVKKLSYAITNKRIIVTSETDTKSIIMPLSDVDDIRIDETGDGNCHVRIGSAVFKASAKKLPILAYRGESGGENNDICKGLVFFNVRDEDGKAIHNLLKPAAALAEG